METLEEGVAEAYRAAAEVVPSFPMLGEDNQMQHVEQAVDRIKVAASWEEGIGMTQGKRGTSTPIVAIDS